MKQLSENVEHDMYLRRVALGEIEGEKTGYPSVDKPWLKYYSEEAIRAEMPECTIYDFLYENNKNYTDRTALNYYGNKISFGELFESIEKTTRALIQNGVGKGSIVTVILPTLPETVYLFYAFSRIGAIANMVDPRTGSEGIRDYICEVQSEFLVAIDVVLPKIKEILGQTAVKKVLVISPADSLPPVMKVLYRIKQHIRLTDHLVYVDWKRFIQEGTAYKGAISYTYEKGKAVAIVHTGGTTGHPKGVLLTNDNLNASAFQCWVSGIDMRREHTWLNILPPFVAYGIGNGLHLPLVIGMETILIPQFDPDQFDKILLKHRPNHMVGVPYHYRTLIKSKIFEKEDLSYIIAPTVGGDAMDIVLEKEVNSFLKSHGCKDFITKGYGMTEVTACATVCTSNECNQIGSVGIPLPHTIVSIFEPDTEKELTYNQHGEVCITGPNTMLGYFENQEASSKIIVRHEDGRNWVHSGDIGYMTEDGMLFIVDRIKRMFIRHDGYKVFPSMIERIIIQHSEVKSCCAVGTPDLEHSQGKLPIAHIVLEDDNYKEEETIKQELNALCAAHLPEYAQPVNYVFHEELPITSVGKVDYRALEK